MDEAYAVSIEETIDNGSMLKLLSVVSAVSPRWHHLLNLA